MVDFSKIFNIVFVAVCAALLLFLLISVIAVAAKGKRKCGAFDIALRVISVIVLIASAVMLAAAVLAMLASSDGSICIVAAEEGDVAAAWFVMSGEATELPMPELFVALSTVIGFGLSAVLFILSLAALIVDCLVANKSDKKANKKKPTVLKMPEQLKREAELERIRKIGESAVRKTADVANAEKSNKPEQTESAEQPAAAQSAAQAAENDDSDFDWRTESAPKQEQTGFVGIKDANDDEFDSFDSFDDVADDASQAQDEYAQQDESAADQDEYTEEFVEEQEQEAADVADDEQVYYDDDEAFTVDDGAPDQEQAYEQDETYEEETYDENAEQEVSADDEYYEQAEYADEQAELEDSEEYDEQAELEESAEYDEQATAYDEVVNERVENPVQPKPAPAATARADIAPDRGIYIPEIRTVTPRSTAASTAEVKKAGATAAKKAGAKAAKKPANKSAKPKKSGAQKREVATNIPPEKKLPVTRRYVILDRHNAVNMFGEYLKERNQAEKDKLTSSINTIIIE